MAKTPRSQCRGPGFNPWSGNEIPHAAPRGHRLQGRVHVMQQRSKVLRHDRGHDRDLGQPNEEKERGGGTGDGTGQ